MTTQPEALRLALRLAEWMEWNDASMEVQNEAADELRRLHEANAELLAALKYLTEYSQQHGVMPSALTTARAAITKAERTTT